MTKPTQFLHTVDGRMFKRSSAHGYTHVVVARANIERSVSFIEESRAYTIARAEKSAREWHQHYTLVEQAGLGGRVPYTKGQGGYGRSEGCEVRQYDVDAAREGFAKHGRTVGGWVSDYLQSAHEHLEDSLTRAREQSTAWYVLSWHHSAALAEKAANTARGIRDVRAEAINGGVQS